MNPTRLFRPNSVTDLEVNMSIFGIFFLLACGSKSEDTAESTDTSESVETTETNEEADIFGNTFTLSGTEGTVGNRLDAQPNVLQQWRYDEHRWPVQ